MTSMSHTPHVDAGMAAGRSQGDARSWVVTANRILGHVVAVPAALLVLAEIAVLSSGIVGRYVFRSPIVWSDELAGILFLWLAMLGSVIAFQRGEHMRMTAIVGVLSAELRAFLDVVAAAASLAFLVLVVWPAYEFAADEAFVTTPALEIVNTWRAAALPIGIGLMLIAAVLRLIRIASLRSLLASLAIVAGIIGTFVLLAPVLKPLGNLNLLIFFVFVVGAMVFAAVPIAFAFGLATVGYLALTTGTPDVRDDRTNGRGHEPPDPACRASLRLSWPSDRDDGHGARHGQLPGEPSRSRAWRTALRAGRGDVSGLGHFRLQGG
ncbi:TRAP-type C4-dicarboxylate transport system permease small subunit [Bradyrhizobium sp. GM22.5]